MQAKGSKAIAGDGAGAGPVLPGLLALALAFAALAATAALADPVLLRLDVPVQRGVIGLRTDWMDTAMVWTSLAGSRAAIAPVALALAAWLFGVRRRAVVAAAVVAVFVAAPLLEIGIKAAVGRPRPDLLPLVVAGRDAFPSGHATTATSFYGLLPVVAARLGASTWVRRIVAIAAAVLILAIAFSRLYLGVHWLTDVLGGIMLGGILVAMAGAAMGGAERAMGSSSCRETGAQPALTRGAAGPSSRRACP